MNEKEREREMRTTITIIIIIVKVKRFYEKKTKKPEYSYSGRRKGAESFFSKELFFGQRMRERGMEGREGV